MLATFLGPRRFSDTPTALPHVLLYLFGRFVGRSLQSAVVEFAYIGYQFDIGRRI